MSIASGPGLDEDVFADGKVTCIGQVIAVVVATSQQLAQRAAKAVTVTYKDLPSVITIEVDVDLTHPFLVLLSPSPPPSFPLFLQDAIAAEQYFTIVRTITQGDADSALAEAKHVIEGEMHVGGQDHFYLETQACICIPKGEDGEMEIIASTQGLNGTQMLAARALGVPANRIVARVKRIGGGFGGKETRSFYLSTAVAVAAHR